ncbi:methyl-accepting chemotaxis protein [Pararobbsia alpina]|uniref:methyl-accepting chemotaxis protein n=1 Tax=Pararobbsia alpina TaxID=621374 RepID=UPI0039A649AC
MSIVRRLVVTLGLAQLALICVSGYGLFQLHASYQRIEGLETRTIPALKSVSFAADQVAAMRFAVYRYVVDGVDDASRSATLGEVADADRRFDETVADYRQHDTVDDADERQLASDQQSMSAYREARTRFFDTLRSGDRDGALAMLHNGGEVHHAALALNEALRGHLNAVLARVDAVRDENARAYRFAIALMLSVTAGALAITGVFGLHVYRLIRSGLREMQGTLEAVTRSLDLSLRAKVGRMDEIGYTATALNLLLAQISDVVSGVRISSDTVGVASKQIAAGNLDLSARTEQQAASLQHTASSLGELTQTARLNADHAREANALADSTNRMSDEGTQAVERMVGTMNDIAGSATRIADITSVINEIAFQTNLLALNAAVEAARAGSQGKGFAVVASEVRNLAQRSAAAAKEIKDLIDRSVATIEAGAQQAREADRATSEIRRSIAQVAEIVERIAAASDAQGQGIELVNRAIVQIDTVTQQNATLVEEVSAASQSLDEQVAQLTDSVSVFVVSAA